MNPRAYLESELKRIAEAQKQKPLNSFFESKNQEDNEEEKTWSNDIEFNEDREDEEDELLFGDIL